MNCSEETHLELDDCLAAETAPFTEGWHVFAIKSLAAGRINYSTCVQLPASVPFQSFDVVELRHLERERRRHHFHF